MNQNMLEIKNITYLTASNIRSQLKVYAHGLNSNLGYFVHHQNHEYVPSYQVIIH